MKFTTKMIVEILQNEIVKNNLQYELEYQWLDAVSVV
jgi:hypothetical protein